MADPSLAGVERCLMARRPRLEQRKLPFARATGEEVPAALQPESPTVIKADADVGAIHFLCNDKVASLQRPNRHLLQILVARLES